MFELSLDDLKNSGQTEFHNIPSSVETFSSVSIDSRNIKEGEVFWAIKGERFDGHDFVESAIEAGALFAVVEKGFDSGTLPAAVVPDTLKALQKLANVHRNKFDIPIIAVTGSNGKTTLKEMLAHILQSDKNVLKTEGNLNNHIGCPLTLMNLKAEHKAAIIEIGSNHPGEIDVLAKISEPTHAVISNIGEAHLEFFKDKEGVFHEKTSLFDDMGVGTNIFINMDDEWLRKYKPENGQQVTRFAFKENADVTGSELEVDGKGRASFILNGKTAVRLQVTGIHNAYNALAAAAVALNLGSDEKTVKEALEGYRAFDKRMQRIELNGAVILNDCYNASPDSMRAAIDTVSRIKNKAALYLVLGDMFELGTAANEAHKSVIKTALSIKSDGIFLLGEAMKAAAEDFKGGKLQILNTNEEAADRLKKLLKPGDLALIKGSRGMKMEEIIEIIEKA